LEKLQLLFAPSSLPELIIAPKFFNLHSYFAYNALTLFHFVRFRITAGSQTWVCYSGTCTEITPLPPRSKCRN